MLSNSYSILVNITLSLVVTLRHDKKLTRLVCRFILRKAVFWFINSEKFLNDIMCDIKMQCEPIYNLGVALYGLGIYLGGEFSQSV